MEISLSSLTPLQKKIAGWGLVFGLVGGGGFLGGIKFTDVKIKAEVGKYQIQVEKLEKNVSDRDITIAKTLQERDDNVKALNDQVKKNVVLSTKADSAVSSYKVLEKKLGLVFDAANNSTTSINTDPVTRDDLEQLDTQANGVIAKKDEQLKGVEAALSNCFDAKAAADRAIAELQSNESDLKTDRDLRTKVNIDLSKQVESEKRRKWLYLLGGIVATYAADHIKK